MVPGTLFDGPAHPKGRHRRARPQAVDRALAVCDAGRRAGRCRAENGVARGWGWPAGCAYGLGRARRGWPRGRRYRRRRFGLRLAGLRGPRYTRARIEVEDEHPLVLTAESAVTPQPPRTNQWT